MATLLGDVRFTPESGHGLLSVQNPFCMVLVGWHRRRFGYCWKQRTRGRCNGNNCGGANHAAQKSATIYGNQGIRRKFPGRMAGRATSRAPLS